MSSARSDSEVGKRQTRGLEGGAPAHFRWPGVAAAGAAAYIKARARMFPGSSTTFAVGVFIVGGRVLLKALLHRPRQLLYLKLGRAELPLTLRRQLGSPT